MRLPRNCIPLVGATEETLPGLWVRFGNALSPDLYQWRQFQSGAFPLVKESRQRTSSKALPGIIMLNWAESLCSRCSKSWNPPPAEFFRIQQVLQVG